MHPEAVTASATVWGVIVAAVFGAGGLVSGIIGLVQANRAKSAAIASNRIARHANELAAEANELIEVANGAIRDQADREIERTDVAWEWRWDEITHSDHVIIQNIGESVAKDVTAQFFFEMAVEANDLPVEMESRHEIKLEIPDLADRRTSAAEARLDGVAWAIAQRDPTAPTPPDETARVRLRVTWVTPKGSPKLYDTGYSDQSLINNAH